MIMIIFINLMALAIRQSLMQKTIQPYGPKMCEELYQTESRYTAHVFDGVHLECKLVSHNSILDLFGKQDFKVCDVNNQSTQAVEKPGGRKRRICPAARVQTFFEAIKNGWLVKVKRLLVRKMVDVNCRWKTGQTAVMTAALYEQKHIFDYLVLQKCDLSAVDEVNDTVLHYACEGGSKYIVQKLLDDHNIDIESRGQGGGSALIETVFTGNVHFLKFLINRGFDINTKDNTKETVLHAACGSVDLPVKMVRYILSLNIIDIESREQNGRTALMNAVENGKREIVKLLMDKGADVHTVDDKNNNILHVACLGGYVNMVKYILSLNITEIDCRGYLGRTPLMQAVEKGKEHVARLLKVRGADMKTVDDVNNTIIHVACVSGYISMVKYILSLKIHDVDCRGIFGRTPLMIAVEHGHVKVVRFLIRRKKAHLTTTDNDGLTVLHIACLSGQFDMVKYLVTLNKLRGIDKRKNQDGDTALQMAMKNCHLGIVSFLKSRE